MKSITRHFDQLHKLDYITETTTKIFHDLQSIVFKFQMLILFF